MTVSPAIGLLPTPSTTPGPAQTMENMVNLKQAQQTFILGAAVVQNEQQMFDTLLEMLDSEPTVNRESLGLDITV